MMLCLCEGRNDSKDLEGVLSVLDRRLYDGCNGGVVFRAGLRPEASADLELGLGCPYPTPPLCHRRPAIYIRPGQRQRHNQNSNDSYLDTQNQEKIVRSLLVLMFCLST